MMRPVLLAIILISFQKSCLSTITEEKYLGEKIQLRLYKNGSTDYEQAPIFQGESLFQESKGYNDTLPLILLIHGMATGADCYFVNGLIDAFVMRNLTNHFNILAIDMPEVFENSVKNGFYIGILANVQPAGEMIGRFLSKIISLKILTPENINVIGYSMGAQVAGYAARIVKNNFGEIHFIAGLDPAGPGFHTMWGGFPALVHVSAADAMITHFYHTNSVSCGTRDRVATADFVFNKGTVQPGCTKGEGLDCSHVRVPALYIEAVATPVNFFARKCSNWEKFRACDCNNHEVVSITFPPDIRANGIYYLRTRSKSPFSLGKKGSRCRKIVQPINGIEHSLLGHTPSHSKPVDKLKTLNGMLHPKNKIKDNINIHLINGIRKIEDLHIKPEVFEQFDPSQEITRDNHE